MEAAKRTLDAHSVSRHTAEDRKSSSPSSSSLRESASSSSALNLSDSSGSRDSVSGGVRKSRRRHSSSLSSSSSSRRSHHRLVVRSEKVVDAVSLGLKDILWEQAGSIMQRPILTRMQLTLTSQNPHSEADMKPRMSAIHEDTEEYCTEEKCYICLDGYSDSSTSCSSSAPVLVLERRTLSCGHMFHQECVERWLFSSSSSSSQSSNGASLSAASSSSSERPSGPSSCESRRSQERKCPVCLILQRRERKQGVRQQPLGAGRLPSSSAAAHTASVSSAPTAGLIPASSFFHLGHALMQKEHGVGKDQRQEEEAKPERASSSPSSSSSLSSSSSAPSIDSTRQHLLFPDASAFVETKAQDFTEIVSKNINPSYFIGGAGRGDLIIKRCPSIVPLLY